jgi:hypothetical protein
MMLVAAAGTHRGRGLQSARHETTALGYALGIRDWTCQSICAVLGRISSVKMKVRYALFPGLASGVYWAFLSGAHAVWLAAWNQLSVRPSYGHPKSWQFGFLAQHQTGYALAVTWFLPLFYMAPIFFIWCIVASVKLWARPNGAAVGLRVFGTALWLSLGVGAALLVVDPLGAITWFVD